MIRDANKMNCVAGQYEMSDCFGEAGKQFDTKEVLTLTGCKRTGCMFCGFGCHMSDDHRFEQMKQTHPKQYEWIMKPWKDGGLGYKEIIDWINEHGNMNTGISRQQKGKTKWIAIVQTVFIEKRTVAKDGIAILKRKA